MEVVDIGVQFLPGKVEECFGLSLWPDLDDSERTATSIAAAISDEEPAEAVGRL